MPVSLNRVSLELSYAYRLHVLLARWCHHGRTERSLQRLNDLKARNRSLALLENVYYIHSRAVVTVPRGAQFCPDTWSLMALSFGSVKAFRFLREGKESAFIHNFFSQIFIEFLQSPTWKRKSNE